MIIIIILLLLSLWKFEQIFHVKIYQMTLVIFVLTLNFCDDSVN